MDTIDRDIYYTLNYEWSTARECGGWSNGVHYGDLGTALKYAKTMLATKPKDYYKVAIQTILVKDGCGCHKEELIKKQEVIYDKFGNAVLGDTTYIR